MVHRIFSTCIFVAFFLVEFLVFHLQKLNLEVLLSFLHVFEYFYGFQAVLWRYRLKEILKKEYLRREFDPHTFKYKVIRYCRRFI